MASNWLSDVSGPVSRAMIPAARIIPENKYHHRAYSEDVLSDVHIGPPSIR